MLLGATWTLWAAGWLRRVELRSELEPTVRALGLAFDREGWGPSVRATGAFGGRRVEVRWRIGLDGRTRARVRGAQGWVRLADAEPEAIRGAINAG